MLKRTIAVAGVLAGLIPAATVEAAAGQATGKRHHKPVMTTVVYQNAPPGGLKQQQQQQNTAPRHFNGVVNRFSAGSRDRRY